MKRIYVVCPDGAALLASLAGSVIFKGKGAVKDGILWLFCKKREMGAAR
jgi:hypothetical protein